MGGLGCPWDRRRARLLDEYVDDLLGIPWGSHVVLGWQTKA